MLASLSGGGHLFLLVEKDAKSLLYVRTDCFLPRTTVIHRYRPYAVASHRKRPHATVSRLAFPVIPSIGSLFHYKRPKPLWMGARCSCPSSGLLLLLHCALPFPCGLTWCPCVMETCFPSSRFPFRRITPSLHHAHSLAGLAVFTSRCHYVHGQMLDVSLLFFLTEQPCCRNVPCWR